MFPMEHNNNNPVPVQMFDTVVSRLRDEHLSVAIFPEGTCHSGPQVLELKVRMYAPSL